MLTISAWRCGVLVNHADATEHGHADGHLRFRDRIHRGAEERDVQVDAIGQPSGERSLRRQKIGITGDEGNVIESEALVREGLHESVELGITGHGMSFCPPQIADARLMRQPAI